MEEMRRRRTLKFGHVSSFLLLVTTPVLLLVQGACGYRDDDYEKFNNLTAVEVEPKDGGNGHFVQIPHSSPPTVRPPPYTISHDKCAPQNVLENWKDTLCGDLNSGYVPQNPMGHKFLDGGTYPFDPIKNKTLQFFRRALPVLKSDHALPKVAKYVHHDSLLREQLHLSSHRVKRGLATREPAKPNPLLFFDASYPDIYDYDQLSSAAEQSPSVNARQRRQRSGVSGGSGNRSGFCDNRGMGYYNRLCKLYNAMWGKSPHNIDRDSSIEVHRHHHASPKQPHRSHHHHHHHSPSHHHHHDHDVSRKHFRQAFHSRPDLTVGESDWTKASKYSQTSRIGSQRSPSSARDVDLPPTPCPSTAEYLTPVFARNHEGAWRYVVQIPKEGYFTQTVEVTKCLTSTCYYMEGSCKTSPRWQSLLVAELYYPDSTFPTTPKTTTTTTPAPPPSTTKKKLPSPLSFLGIPEEYPDYLYSKGTSASLENLSGNAYSNELLGLSMNRAKRSPVDAQAKKETSVCDGYDDVGCFQLRLFYDWFLIPGACKCWRRQFDFTLPSNSG